MQISRLPKVSGSNQVIIKTRELSLDERTELSQKLNEKFGVDESTITAESISSTVSNEMRQDAIVAVIIAAICMLIYIWLRFKDIRFGASAVACSAPRRTGRAGILCDRQNLCR